MTARDHAFPAAPAVDLASIGWTHAGLLPIGTGRAACILAALHPERVTGLGFGAAPGDPAYAAMAEALARRPRIAVPTVSLAPDSDGFVANRPDDDREQFTGPFRGRLLRGVGHNPPQEQPASFAAAVMSLLPARE